MNKWLGSIEHGRQTRLSLCNAQSPSIRLECITMPLIVIYFTIGAYSQCIVEKEDHVGNMVGLFCEVTTIHIIDRHKRHQYSKANNRSYMTPKSLEMGGGVSLSLIHHKFSSGLCHQLESRDNTDDGQMAPLPSGELQVLLVICMGLALIW